MSLHPAPEKSTPRGEEAALWRQVWLHLSMSVVKTTQALGRRLHYMTFEVLPARVNVGSTRSLKSAMVRIFTPQSGGGSANLSPSGPLAVNHFPGSSSIWGASRAMRT